MPNVGTASLDLEIDRNRLGSNIRSAVSSQSTGIKSQFAGMGRQGGDAMSSAFKGALKITAIAGAAFAAAGAAAVGFGVKAAANFQQTRIAFEGILGSAEKAQAFLQKMRDFAAKTPFEFPELADAAKQLLAVGFNAEDVIPTMTRLGNVAAALGVGGDKINDVVRALGQMKGKGKASAEELQQISEAIPGFSAINAIAEDMGITTAEAFKLMEKGAIPATQAIDSILRGMEKFPGAAGAMDRQSKTLNGVISTLKDTFRDALIDGIEPFLPAISEGIADATPAIKGAISGLITGITSAISGIATAWDALMGGFQNPEASIGSSVGGFEAVFLRIGQVVRQVVDWIRDNWPQIREIIADVVDWIGTYVVPVVQEYLGYLVANFQKVVSWVQENWPAISETIGHIVVVVREVFDALLPILIPVWEAIKALVSSAITIVLGIIQTVMAIINGDWGAAWEGIKSVLSGIWEQIKAIITLAIDLVKGSIEGTLSAIGAIWGVAWENIKNVFGGIWDAIKGAAVSALVFLIEHISGAVTAFLDLASHLPFVGGKFAGLADDIRRMASDATNALQGITNRDIIVAATVKIADAVQSASPFATGGEVPGTGNGDTVPAWLTPGEFVFSKPAVKAIGVENLEATHRAARGFAMGGYVDLHSRIPGTDDINSWAGSIEDIVDKKARDVAEKWAKEHPMAALGGIGNGQVGGGWQAITRWLDSVGEPYQVTSTVRPGSITSSGNLSLHSLGRAVDMVSDNMLRLGLRLASGIGGSLAELIHTPMGFAIKNGQRVAPYAAADHYDHVHAATMHTGGLVPGGRSDEMLALLQGGERVIPAGVGNGQPFVVQVVVDKRVIGEVTSEALYERQKAYTG